MANIEDSTIGLPIKSAADYLFDGEALVQNATITSETFALGLTQNALDLVVEAATEITVANGGVLTVTWTYGAAFGTDEVLYTVTAGVAGETIPAGTELARFTPNTNFPTEGRLEVSVTNVVVTGSVNAYPILISR